MVMDLLTEVCVIGEGMQKHRGYFTYRSHDLISRSDLIQEVSKILFLSLTTVWRRDDCDVQSVLQDASCALARFALIARGSSGENWVMLVIHRDDPIRDPYRDPIEIKKRSPLRCRPRHDWSRIGSIFTEGCIILTVECNY